MMKLWTELILCQPPTVSKNFGNFRQVMWVNVEGEEESKGMVNGVRNGSSRNFERVFFSVLHFIPEVLFQNTFLHNNYYS